MLGPVKAADSMGVVVKTPVMMWDIGGVFTPLPPMKSIAPSNGFPGIKTTSGNVVCVLASMLPASGKRLTTNVLVSSRNSPPKVGSEGCRFSTPYTREVQTCNVTVTEPRGCDPV
jgi:hypothetical protein